MPSNSNISAPVLERKFHVNDMMIAAQHWGIGNKTKIIALHGWMDNSASFQFLAPRLTDCEVIAIDMAGHGHSDHRCRHGAYNIWDDLLDIIAIADKMNWPTFTLLAHSRGSFASLLMASAVPERIEKLVMLDGILTIASEPSEAPKQLAEYLRDQRNNYQKPSRVYPSIDIAIARRVEKLGLEIEECRPLIERALEPAKAGGWQWRHDARIAGSSAFKLTELHQQAFLKQMKTSSLLILAEDGFAKWPEVKVKLVEHPNIQLMQHPGCHHLHMQADQCDSIAKHIDDFLAKQIE